MGLKNKMKAALVRCKLPKYQVILPTNLNKMSSYLICHFLHLTQILANGLCLLCCYKWDSDPEAAFPDDGADDGEDEGIVVSSASSGRSDEPIIALRNVEPLQVRTLKCLHIS